MQEIISATPQAEESIWFIAIAWVVSVLMLVTIVFWIYEVIAHGNWLGKKHD